jgi:hypothetical protein
MEGIFLILSWNVEYTDEFENWWNGLTKDEQEDVAAVVMLLIEHGPQLPFPYSSGIEGSNHSVLSPTEAAGPTAVPLLWPSPGSGHPGSGARLP